MRTVKLATTLILSLALIAAACGEGGDDAEAARPALPPGMMPPPGTNADATPPAVPFDATTPRTTARAVRSWPHDTAAFTQGLLVHGNRLLESTGLEGYSDVREVELASGKVLRRVPLRSGEFGEGIAVVGNRLYQLTWRGARGYIYDASSLALADSFPYEGEGWGLATDGRLLYLSDGTSRVRVIDPATRQVQRTITVNEGGRAVHMLNELEWVRGELWANIYQTDMIARIAPDSGRIIGWIDLANLLTPDERRRVNDRGGVANGIAWDSAHTRLLVTGKHWPRLIQVEMPAAK